MKKKNLCPQFLIILVFAFALMLVLQSCATLLGDPDQMDGANWGSGQADPMDYSQSAPQMAEMPQISQTPQPPQTPTTSDSDASSESDRARQFQARVYQAIHRDDIVLGMSEQDVLASWGQPRDVQVAGESSNGNERWVYYTANSLLYGIGNAKIIYFEDGRVVGWQTSHADKDL